MNFKFANKEYNVKFWNGEKLSSKIVLDTETTVVPFYMTPELVTIQAYDGSSDVFYISLQNTQRFFEIHHESDFIFHNAPFDLDVLFHNNSFTHTQSSLYDAERIYDTSVLYRLYHLAVAGFIPFKYNLNYITQKLVGETLDKDSDTRVTFEQYLGKPVEDISEEHLIYGAKDVVATYLCYEELMRRIKRLDKDGTLLSHNIQVKGELALLHIHKNGIGFDLKLRDEWMSSMNHHLDIVKHRMACWGWYRGLKGNKQKFESICKDILNIDLPYKYKGDIVEKRGEKWYFLEGNNAGCEAPEGNLSTSREDLEPFSNKSFIKDYLKFIEMEKATTFVRDIESDTVHPRYNSMVNTGRTSCSKPNFQQLPRAGDVRNMFKAKKGNTLIITDYSAIELATLSQVSYNKFGESVMGDKINDGADLHRYYASVLYSKDITDVTKDERQSAKAANFGFPGGLGIDTFIQFARGYSLNLTREEAQQMKDTWFEAFPEMKKYMKDEVGYVYTLTGRKRGNTTYCAEKNTPFQGLAADGAKLALYNLDKAGFKVVGFVHDEIICEVLEQDAEKLVKDMEQIMIDSMKIVVPDVKIGVESQISERYCK